MSIHYVPVDKYDPAKHPLPLAGEDIEPHFWVTIGDDDHIYSWRGHPEFPGGFTPEGAKTGDPILVRHDKLPGAYPELAFKAYLYRHEIKIYLKNECIESQEVG